MTKTPLIAINYVEISQGKVQLSKRLEINC